MKWLLRVIRRGMVHLLVALIYGWGCLCYDKRYLTGENFDRHHLSQGWIWILQDWFGQKVLRRNSHVPWPVPAFITIAAPRNIHFDPDDMRNFRTVGTYFQGINAAITIGKGTMIAPGVGFITANHDFKDVHKSQPGKDISLGEQCWIGMNAVVLPGVSLGAHTIVGAGAVVTKSFPEGHCVLVGNPAVKKKEL